VKEKTKSCSLLLRSKNKNKKKILIGGKIFPNGIFSNLEKLYLAVDEVQNVHLINDFKYVLNQKDLIYRI